MDLPMLHSPQSITHHEVMSNSLVVCLMVLGRHSGVRGCVEFGPMIPVLIGSSTAEGDPILCIVEKSQSAIRGIA
jgi:hypothetical protein